MTQIGTDIGYSVKNDLTAFGYQFKNDLEGAGNTLKKGLEDFGNEFMGSIADLLGGGSSGLSSLKNMLLYGALGVGGVLLLT